MHVTKTGQFTYMLYDNGKSFRVTQRQDGYFVEPQYGGGKAGLTTPEELDNRFSGSLAEIRKLAYR